MKQSIQTLALCLFVAAVIMPVAAFAIDTDLHGYVESRYIVRDTSGFQDGFLDDTQSVQWIQELQLDMTVRPEYPKGKPDFRVEKFFFRYRGAYDAIYDITDRYDGVRDSSPSDVELGKDDLKLDQDLRECFADVIWEQRGSFRSNLRLGKQIVQWGDADVFNLVNIVNPSDFYNKAFFSNPEDLAAPLWMARYDVTLPTSGYLSDVNLQLLAIPDIRPSVFGPLGAPYSLGAPYVDESKGFGFDNTEFGIRLGATTLSGAFYLYYFDGYQDLPAVDITTLGAGYLTLRHPETKTFGYSFSRFFEAGNFVLRGEGSLTQDKTFGDYAAPLGYSEHDFYQVLFGIDKSLSSLPIGTRSALTTAFQLYYSKIDDWDEDVALGRTAPEDIWRATMLLTTDYANGTVTPVLSVLYDSEDAWFTYAELKWSPHGTWYSKVSVAAVFGDEDGMGDYNPYIDTQSEIAIRIGYQF